MTEGPSEGFQGGQHILGASSPVRWNPYLGVCGYKPASASLVVLHLGLITLDHSKHGEKRKTSGNWQKESSHPSITFQLNNHALHLFRAEGVCKLLQDPWPEASQRNTQLTTAKRKSI